MPNKREEPGHNEFPIRRFVSDDRFKASFSGETCQK